MFVPWSSLCRDDRVCLMRRIALDVTGSGGGRAAATLFLSFCIIWTRHELKYRHGLCVWQHRTNGPLTDTIEAEISASGKSCGLRSLRHRNTSTIHGSERKQEASSSINTAVCCQTPRTVNMTETLIIMIILMTFWNSWWWLVRFCCI